MRIGSNIRNLMLYRLTVSEQLPRDLVVTGGSKVNFFHKALTVMSRLLQACGDPLLVGLP